MLVILAHPADCNAAMLVERWKRLPARLLTCGDLSRPGWQYRPGEADDSLAVVSGQPIKAREITGVLVRLPRIAPELLPHFVSADRAYVAGEMTAFLAAWLKELSCPILNRPSPLCLLGPAWTPQQWAYTAMGLGAPVAPPHSTNPVRTARNPKLRSAHALVVAGRCFGAVEKPLAALAVRLAEKANVDLLQVTFDRPTVGARFLSANVCPNLQSAEELDAALDFYRRAKSACSKGVK